MDASAVSASSPVSGARSERSSLGCAGRQSRRGHRWRPQLGHRSRQFTATPVMTDGSEGRARAARAVEQYQAETGHIKTIRPLTPEVIAARIDLRVAQFRVLAAATAVACGRERFTTPQGAGHS